MMINAPKYETPWNLVSSIINLFEISIDHLHPEGIERRAQNAIKYLEFVSHKEGDPPKDPRDAPDISNSEEWKNLKYSIISEPSYDTDFYMLRVFAAERILRTCYPEIAKDDLLEPPFSFCDEYVRIRLRSAEAAKAPSYLDLIWLSICGDKSAAEVFDELKIVLELSTDYVSSSTDVNDITHVIDINKFIILWIWHDYANRIAARKMLFDYKYLIYEPFQQLDFTRYSDYLRAGALVAYAGLKNSDNETQRLEFHWSLLNDVFEINVDPRDRDRDRHEPSSEEYRWVIAYYFGALLSSYDREYLVNIAKNNPTDSQVIDGEKLLLLLDSVGSKLVNIDHILERINFTKSLEEIELPDGADPILMSVTEDIFSIESPSYWYYVLGYYDQNKSPTNNTSQTDIAPALPVAIGELQPERLIEMIRRYMQREDLELKAEIKYQITEDIWNFIGEDGQDYLLEAQRHVLERRLADACLDYANAIESVFELSAPQDMRVHIRNGLGQFVNSAFWDSFLSKSSLTREDGVVLTEDLRRIFRARISRAHALGKIRFAPAHKIQSRMLGLSKLKGDSTRTTLELLLDLLKSNS